MPQIVFDKEDPTNQAPTAGPKIVFDQAQQPTDDGGPGQAILEFGQAFNRQLADMIGGMPGPQSLEMVNKAMGWLGQSGLLEEGWSARDASKEAFKQAGMSADNIDTIADNLGEGIFNTGIMAAALISGAPGMAAIRDQGLWSGIIKSLGQSIQAAPGAALATEGLATVGAEVAPRMLPEGSPQVVKDLAAVGGGMTGAGAGKALTGPTMGKAVGAITGAGMGSLMGLGIGPAGVIGGTVSGARVGSVLGRKTAERVIRQGIPTAKTPMITQTRPQDATEYAREVLEGDYLRIENTIKRAVASARSESDPIKSAQILQTEVRKSYAAARAKEGKYWQKVDGKKTVDATRLRNFASTIIRENSKLAPENLPATILGRFKRLKGRETVKDLLALRGVILSELRNDAITNDTYRRNLNLLQDSILNSIRKAHPNDKSLIRAQEYSKWLHDHFTRGPAGRLIGRKRVQDIVAGSDPLKDAEALIRHTQSGRILREAAEVLDRPQLEEAAAMHVRNTFQELAARMGPEAGQKYLARPEVQRFMREFPKHDADMKIASRELRMALDERKMIERSAFKSFTDTDAQSAVEVLFRDHKKILSTREIMTKLKGIDDDGARQDALSGFRNAVLTKFFELSNGSMSNMKNLLHSRDIRGMFNEAFSPPEMARLTRMINAGVRYEDKGLIGRKGGSFNTLFARVWGAGIAREILGGSTTIQQSGAAAQMAQTVQTALTGEVPAIDLFARAMLDPKFERVLYSRVPETIQEFQKWPEAVRALMGSIAGLNALDLTGIKDDD